MIMKWISRVAKASKANQIVPRFALISARRKFPSGVIPITAISSVFMLRHLMAGFEPEVSSVGTLQ
jgi:hypothetical protein